MHPSLNYYFDFQVYIFASLLIVKKIDIWWRHLDLKLLSSELLYYPQCCVCVDQSCRVWPGLTGLGWDSSRREPPAQEPADLLQAAGLVWMWGGDWGRSRGWQPCSRRCRSTTCRRSRRHWGGATRSWLALWPPLTARSHSSSVDTGQPPRVTGPRGTGCSVYTANIKHQHKPQITAA